MRLTLPFPPSVNTYWRSNRGRVHISNAGRAYRAAVIGAVIEQRPGAGFGGARLSVVVEVFPPDKRRRDLDNVLKATLDALEHAGVYDDDGQIDRLVVERGHRLPPDGLVIVTVEEM